MTKSIIRLHKIDSISVFRKENQSKIKSVKPEGQNCIYFKLKNGTTEIVRNYHEYKIDDKYLSEHLCEQFWHNSKSNAYNPDFKFNYNWVGYIGSFNKFWDRIKILSLLRMDYRKEDLLNEVFVQNYLKKVDKEHHNSVIQSILNEFDSSEVPIYGCKICGDKECGTLSVKIDLYNDVTWTFNDKERTLKWVFDKKQYISEFQKQLKSVS